MKQDIVYKVVLGVADCDVFNSLCGGKYGIQYVIGQSYTATIGGFFAFDTLENAKNFMISHYRSGTILVCTNCKNVRKVKYMAAATSDMAGTVELFWKQKKNHVKYTNAILAPEGTVIMDSFYCQSVQCKRFYSLATWDFYWG